VQEKTAQQPLPEKIVALLQEARWLVLGGVALYIGLILFGYSKADPGWSHAAQVERIANPGGRVGAWLADLLLYLFGLSAWWWVLFLLFLVVWGYRRLEGLFHTDRRPFFIALSGFHRAHRGFQRPGVAAAETLEYTSRLIERKLADFGVR
jgi:S-DNA-T family DNA segregation ATPase FtsK/SpoIIIE